MLALQLGISLLPLTFRARGQNLDIAEVTKSFTTYFAIAKQTSESMLKPLKKSKLAFKHAIHLYIQTRVPKC